MQSIIYVSAARIAFSENDLQELSTRAAEVNSMKQVTGHLHYSASRFVQYIEGEQDALAEVMVRIQEDDRHQILHQFTEDSLASRRCPTWAMRWLRRADFVQVQLENLLADYVAAASRNPLSRGYYESQVWRLADQIAAQQERLMQAWKASSKPESGI